MVERVWVRERKVRRRAWRWGRRWGVWVEGVSIGGGGGGG